MARIAGVDLARNKRIEIALGYIYGVGRATANKILKDTGVNPDTKVHELTEGDIKKIREYLQTIRVEGDLRRDITMNIKRLIDIGSYRGLRHKRGLPVRGQRTKTNSRTRKGPRKTVGVMRKEVKAMVDNTAAKK
ncbi:MAG: 30S ribosomal protein S13 [Candidatus Firestonebacteria bacterium GWA2_43_8]|nr:MAG: 30S ribosomal protein S13 [Candidatus Firestonebacteria bacterium GWA2_43_8]